ncbi:MAG TPA: prepilin-type N-terminal cleavage/methylation domain-containing protein [Longimicrobiales bacterium]
MRIFKVLRNRAGAAGSRDPHTASAHAPRAERNGFSLVEVMVATMVLTVGLLAMAASTGYLSAQLRSTTFDTRRTAAKQQVVEQLRATPWASLPTNAQTYSVGNYTVTARATVSGLAAVVQLATTGPAYRARRGTQTDVTDTMSFTIARPF